MKNDDHESRRSFIKTGTKAILAGFYEHQEITSSWWNILNWNFIQQRFEANI